jgi:hypothetical protein
MVFNFTNLARGSQLEEGTARLETLMRFARAQAANSGRKVQLVFGPEAASQVLSPTADVRATSTGEVRATWEPDPLGQPGCYAELEEAFWHLHEVNDLVQVEAVRLLDAGGNEPATQPLEEEEEESADLVTSKAISPITFYPDGSSDSAEIIVATRSEEEQERMAVRLVGITGSISHQLLSAGFDEVLESEASRLDPWGLNLRERTIRDMPGEAAGSSENSSSESRTSSPRALQPAPRATVGQTNDVDLIE